MIDPHLIGMVIAIWGGVTLFMRDERKRQALALSEWMSCQDCGAPVVVKGRCHGCAKAN